MRTSIEALILDFSKLCIRYPQLSIPSVFNRYMQIITAEQIELLKPNFMLMIKTGESARESDEKIQKMILES